MRQLTFLTALFLFNTAAHAQAPPLVPEHVARALAAELSGELAKRTLQEITRHHRIRGSREFRAAAEHILGELRRYGIDARG
jgi:hypothetical protein